MADLPEVRSTRLPDRRPLYDHAPTFGAAADAERIRQGIAPPPIRRGPPRTTRLGWSVRPDVDRDHPLDHRVWQCRARARTAPLYGRSWTHLRHVWSSRNSGPADVWHRMMCRRGKHEFLGGTAMQLGSRFVHVERRCRWCGAPPS